MHRHLFHNAFGRNNIHGIYQVRLPSIRYLNPESGVVIALRLTLA